MCPAPDHTTDVIISVSGTTLPDLFSGALKQMSGILRASHCGETTTFDCCKLLRLRGSDTTLLLVDFLSEALSLTYIEKAIFCHVYFLHLDENQLTALLYGRWYARLENEIKAVTFHEAEVVKTPQGSWEATLICDL